MSAIKEQLNDFGLKSGCSWIVIGTNLWLLFDLIYFYEQYMYYSLS
jgi:hypothetical protein